MTDDCSNNDTDGYDVVEHAPYISHMASMFDFKSGSQLFGIGSSSNHAGNKAGFFTMVWRVEIDGLDAHADQDN